MGRNPGVKKHCSKCFPRFGVNLGFKASKMSRNTKKDKYSSNSEGSSASNAANFNSDDREKMHEIYCCMKKLESQVHKLKAKLNNNNEEMLNLKAENIKLK